MAWQFQLLLLLSAFAAVTSDLRRDRTALLNFLSQTPHKNKTQWNESVSTCEWIGVTCDTKSNSVVALRLPGVGLIGPIPPETLSSLSDLRVLSLRSNRLFGPIPPNLFANLISLRYLYLQNNHFSGQIPRELGRMTSLIRINLSGNNLTGEIPNSITNLTSLTSLFLQNNTFTGEIPKIAVAGLTDLNLSYNSLHGSIPRTLARFPPSSFAGNLDLCGAPLRRCPSRTLSTVPIVLISIAALLLLIVIFLALLTLCRRRHSTEKKTSKPEPNGNGKLVVFGNGGRRFDLNDLLSSSAEVLGKGIYGTTYKAGVAGGDVAVKRLREIARSGDEFEARMGGLGEIRHDNIVALLAFYNSKDEKLLVYDYVPGGSLSGVLHGNREAGRVALGWNNRVRVAMAVARGLAYLHRVDVVHGDVKASNVLLRPDPDAAAVSDFGLAELFAPGLPDFRAGYRAPELIGTTNRPAFKSDVYSFGILLLELLTGKSADAPSLREEKINLLTWVGATAREGSMHNVFDSDLVRYVGQEELNQMEEVLQIALACLSPTVDSRLDMEHVVTLLQAAVMRSYNSSDLPSPPLTP